MIKLDAKSVKHQPDGPFFVTCYEECDDPNGHFSRMASPAMKTLRKDQTHIGPSEELVEMLSKDELETLHKLASDIMVAGYIMGLVEEHHSDQVKPYGTARDAIALIQRASELRYAHHEHQGMYILSMPGEIAYSVSITGPAEVMTIGEEPSDQLPHQYEDYRDKAEELGGFYVSLFQLGFFCRQAELLL